MADEPANSTDPQWFRPPTAREHRLGAALFIGFGLFFFLFFLFLSGWFRWVILILAIISIARGARHAIISMHRA